MKFKLFSKSNLILGLSSVILFVLMIFMLFGCSKINIFEKESCENSGGEYTKGFSETAGVFYYCKCPITKYETYSKTCSKITQDLINKCINFSNDFFDCKNSELYIDYYGEGVCKCVFKESNRKSFIVYKEVLECNCKCYEDICTCICPSYRK